MKNTTSLASTSLVLTLVASVLISQADAGLEEGIAANQVTGLALLRQSATMDPSPESMPR